MDDMGVSKLLAKVSLKVNYSFKEGQKLHWYLFSKDGIKVLLQMHSATHAAGDICHVAVKF